MKFEVHIGTENAAFEGGPGPELARILRALADRVEDSPLGMTMRLHDANGNRVGFAALTDANGPSE